MLNGGDLILAPTCGRRSAWSAHRRSYSICPKVWARAGPF